MKHERVTRNIAVAGRGIDNGLSARRMATGHGDHDDGGVRGYRTAAATAATPLVAVAGYRRRMRRVHMVAAVHGPEDGQNVATVGGKLGQPANNRRSAAGQDSIRRRRFHRRPIGQVRTIKVIGDRRAPIG